MIQDWRGRRVTVMGLGRFEGGVGVTRWLAAQGARVLVTDTAPAERLGSSLRQIEGLHVELRLGGHAERDFVQTDLVVVNPAVPDRSPFLQAARQAGAPITTEINLFVERCPGRCVGVTGSVGKSTITAMIGHVLEQTLDCGRVWVGGNLGRCLLDQLPEIKDADVVVLELSSFQLHRTPLVRWSPYVAVVSPISPNHLDWHGTFEAYVAAKANIFAFQDPGRDHLVLHSRLVTSDVLRPPSGTRSSWSYGLRDRAVPIGAPIPSPSGSDAAVMCWPDLRLRQPGAHNRENAAAALTVASLFPIDSARAAASLERFEGLPHRLQRVAARDGVTYYNDSKSTTPEATLTAMSALDGPLLLILGGYDKGIDLRPAASQAARRAKYAACIGQTGPRLAEWIRAAGGRAELHDDLPAAVEACRRHAQPGDAVLLSPACASWGLFEDYRARGEAFVRLVTSLS